MDEKTALVATSESEHVRRLEAALILACMPERELIALARERGFEVEHADTPEVEG